MALYKHIPNTITSMNLLSGVMGVIFTLEGRLEWALPLMLLAAAFDFCDGLAARLLDRGYEIRCHHAGSAVCLGCLHVDPKLTILVKLIVDQLMLAT